MASAVLALGYARRQWRGMSVLSAIMLAEVALSVLHPWPMKWLIDDLLRPPQRPAAGLRVCYGRAVRHRGGAVDGADDGEHLRRPRDRGAIRRSAVERFAVRRMAEDYVGLCSRLAAGRH